MPTNTDRIGVLLNVGDRVLYPTRAGALPDIFRVCTITKIVQLIPRSDADARLIREDQRDKPNPTDYGHRADTTKHYVLKVTYGTRRWGNGQKAGFSIRFPENVVRIPDDVA